MKIHSKILYFIILLISFTWEIGNTQNLKIQGEFPNQSLKWPFLWDLKILNNGELLCSSDAGQIFNKKGNTWEIIDVPNISKESIRGVIKDKDGNLWAATDGEGISRLKNGQWENYKKGTNSLPSNDWKCATMDNTGNLWFGSWLDGVVKYDGSTWRLYTKNNSATTGLASNTVTGIFVDKTNKVWVYSFGDITIINGNTIKKINLEDLIVFGIRINDIYQDKNGKFYLATSKGIVTSNNGTTFIHEKEKFGQIDISSVAVDKSNVIWYCEQFSGIHRWDNGVKHYFEGTLDNLIPSQTFEILVDSLDRKLLIGNKGSQVIFIEDSEFTSSTDEQNSKVDHQISVFPNPTNGIINFENVNGQLNHVNITNEAGNRFSENISENAIDISHYSPGIYIIQLIDLTEGKSKFIKVLKI
ncbi:MAG: T9SS type A sorting domain-containing protein [Saprospiraceae bacterium]|nr:T9SS type A sorting domain-containing protein [Saprospiraceae bacterium]